MARIDFTDIDKVIGEVMDEMNSDKKLKNIQQAFCNKLDPAQYDKALKEQMDIYEQLKKIHTREELDVDNANYYLNKRNDKYKDIPDALLIYKHPETAYLCEGGWMYSSKKRSPIEQHNKSCPVYSYYDCVPAYTPINVDNDD